MKIFKKTHRVLSIFLVAILGQLMVAVLSAHASDKGDKGQLSSSDYKFACEATHAGAQEVALSQLASERAQEQSVKDFAQRMVQDHQKANQELAQLLSQKGATISDAPTNKSRMSAKLQALSGADFDKAYMKMMVGDHKKAVKLFTKESEKGDDADLKSWSAKTLPTLEDHLNLAQTTASSASAKP